MNNKLTVHGQYIGKIDILRRNTNDLMDALVAENARLHDKNEALKDWDKQCKQFTYQIIQRHFNAEINDSQGHTIDALSILDHYLRDKLS